MSDFPLPRLNVWWSEGISNQSLCHGNDSSDMFLMLSWTSWLDVFVNCNQSPIGPQSWLDHHSSYSSHPTTQQQPFIAAWSFHAGKNPAMSSLEHMWTRCHHKAAFFLDVFLCQPFSDRNPESAMTTGYCILRYCRFGTTFIARFSGGLAIAIPSTGHNNWSMRPIPWETSWTTPRCLVRKALSWA